MPRWLTCGAVAAATSCHLLVPLNGLRGTAEEGGGGTNGEGGSLSDPIPKDTPPVCPAPSFAGRRIVVTLDGADTNDGTALSPLRTIATALKQAGPGDVVVLGAGTFVEDSTLNLAVGVSVSGEGPELTTIRVASGDAIFRGSLVDASLYGFTIEGNSRSVAYGLQLSRLANASIGSFHALRFSTSAFEVDHASKDSANVTLCALKLTQCGSRDDTAMPFADHACLELSPIDKLHLYDIQIDTDEGPGIRMDLSTPQSVREFRAEYLDVRVPAVRNEDNAPQYSLTLRGSSTLDAIVANSTFTGLVGFWQDGDLLSSVRVHHSRFIPQSAALEIDVNGAEIDHNYVSGGYYWLFNLNSAPSRKSLVVHHNVLEGQTYPNPLGFLSPTWDGFLFAYNTVIFRGDLSSTDYFGLAQGSTIRVLNNLFLKESGLPPKSLGAPVVADVRANFFQFAPPPGATENFEGDVTLVGGNDEPDPAYRLVDSSPANAGAVEVVDLNADDPKTIGACSAESRPCVGHAWVP